MHGRTITVRHWFTAGCGKSIRQSRGGALPWTVHPSIDRSASVGHIAAGANRVDPSDRVEVTVCPLLHFPPNPMATVQKKPKTIVDLATQDGGFTSFLDALSSTKLDRTLKGSGPFTVFAPTDEAFERLSKGARKSLMKASNKDQLRDLLQYHVFEGRKQATDVAATSSLKMLNGESMPIEKKGNVVYVGDAAIRRTNLEAENGIIHVIDRVQLPASVQA